MKELSSGTLSPEGKATGRATKFRVVILVLACVLSVLNYLDRSVIAFFAQVIMHDFQIDKAGYGMLAGAFGLGYVLFTFIGGWLADVLGARKLFGITCVLWGVCTMGIGAARGFVDLLVARTALGAAEGPVYPGMIKAFNDWMGGGERTRAIALAIPVSVGTAVILAGPLSTVAYSLTNDWRPLFFVLGVLSILVGLVWYIMFRDNPADSKHVNQAELDVIHSGPRAVSHSAKPVGAEKITVGALLRDPTLLSIYLGFFCFGYFFWFALTWLPNLLQESYNISLKSSALLSALPWVGYVIGSLSGGWISDRSMQRTGRSAIKKHLIWGGLLGATVCLVPIFLFHSLPVAVICFTLALGISGICVPPLWALNNDIVPQRPGLSSGIMDATFAASGVLAPLISGFVAQYGGGFATTLIVSGAVTGVGVLVVGIFANPDKSARHFAELTASGGEPKAGNAVAV